MTMAMDPVIDRSFLHFPEETRRRFAFLEALGFRCLRSEATLVRYESTAMAICIYQGRQSYEVGLEIQSAEAPTQSYSFSEILRLVDPKRADGYRNFAARTAEGVAKGVLRLAGLLHECLDAGILSDERLFSRLKLQRIDMSRNYALEVKLKGAQNELKSAWAKKDFSKVIQILSPLQEHLNPSDLKKLEYAKKHR